MDKVSPDDVRGWAQEFTALIPAGFFVAMAERESGFDQSNVTYESNGQTSIGLLQINNDEAASAGFANGDLKDGRTNIEIGASLFLQRLQNLANRYSFVVDNPPHDVWYYLAVAHNAGLGRAEQWIDESGFNWDETKQAHSSFPTIARGYAQYIGDSALADSAPSSSPLSTAPTSTLMLLVAIGAATVWILSKWG